MGRGKRIVIDLNILNCLPFQKLSNVIKKISVIQQGDENEHFATKGTKKVPCKFIPRSKFKHKTNAKPAEECMNKTQK